jgi:hypothetical protein
MHRWVGVSRWRHGLGTDMRWQLRCCVVWQTLHRARFFAINVVLKDAI